jgi:predicted SAM-dependent methyltransferase
MENSEIIEEVESICIDFGCGQSKAKVEDINNGMNVKVTKVIGVDFVQEEGVDVVHNLTSFPYPFEDESVDVIYNSHFLEHLDGFERAKFMDEAYRILKPNGKMRCIHPYAKSVRAFQDFTHKFPPIVETSYAYFNKAWRDANKLTHGYYNLKSNFDAVIYYQFQDPTAEKKNDETRAFMCDKYWNVVADLIVDMTKL